MSFDPDGGYGLNDGDYNNAIKVPPPRNNSYAPIAPSGAVKVDAMPLAAESAGVMPPDDADSLRLTTSAARPRPCSGSSDLFNNLMIDADWTLRFGMWIETSTKARSSNPLTYVGLNYLEHSCEFADGSAYITTADVSQDQHVVIRSQPGGSGLSGYTFGHDALIDEWNIWRSDDGTLVYVAGPVTAPLSGDELGIRVTGTTIEALVNGFVVATAIDGTYASGRSGLATKDAGCVFTSWRHEHA